MADPQPDQEAAIYTFTGHNYIEPHATTLPERPRLYALYQAMTKKAGVSDTLYTGGYALHYSDNSGIADGKFPMATTAFSAFEPNTIISEGMLALFTDEEAAAFLAHELGHAKHPIKNTLTTSRLHSLVEHADVAAGAVGGAGLAVAAFGTLFVAHQIKKRRPREDDKEPPQLVNRRTALKVGAAGVIGAITAGWATHAATSDCNRTGVEQLADSEAIGLCAHAFLDEARQAGHTMSESEAVEKAKTALASGMRKLKERYHELGIEPSDAHGNFEERIQRIESYNPRSIGR